MAASLLSDPSIKKLLARGRVPFTEKSKPLENPYGPGRETPGSVTTNSIGLSPGTTRLLISTDERLWLISPLSVCSSRPTALTSTIVSDEPTLSLPSAVVTTDAFTTTSSNFNTAKLGAFISIV